VDAHRFSLRFTVAYLEGVTNFSHLAQLWEGEMHPAASSRANNLSSIDLLVLFDLLGTSGPRIPSYFPTTHWAYSSMSNVEKQLRSKDLLSTSKTESWLFEGEHYATNIYKGGIEDDHLPFLHRGVEILHIIPVQPFKVLLTEIPFPREWHTIDVLFRVILLISG
jgi:glutaminyl-peptide cyclotransferase